MVPQQGSPSAFVPMLFVLVAVGAVLLLGSSLPVGADGHDEWHSIYLPRVDANATSARKPQEHLEVGTELACRVDDEGQLTCWHLYDGAQSSGLPGRYRQVDIGLEGMCGTRLDGQILCGNAFDGLDPWTAPPGPYTQVRTGWDNACALREDGTIACWLWEVSEDGTASLRTYPGPSGNFHHLELSGDIVCGLAADYTVTCASGNGGGPEWPGPVGGIAQIEMSPWGGGPGGMALLLRTDGSVLWWDSRSGAIQDGPAGPFRQISWRDWPACGLRTDGGVECWESEDEPMPAPSAAVRTIATGDGALCAIDDTGATRCWAWQGDSLEPLPVP